MDDLKRTHVSLSNLQTNLASLDKMMGEKSTDKETLFHIRNALLELNSEISLIKNVIGPKETATSE